MSLPATSFVGRDDTHRLIPSRYSGGTGTVLERLVGNDDELRALFELDGATNDRLLGEAGKLPGISVHELVFGVPYAHIVNAAFTHPRPLGSRFSGPDRGVWYASFSLRTAQAEVAFHKGEELREIDWDHAEMTAYTEYLSDFRTSFHDLRHDDEYKPCLDPGSYTESQALGRELLNAGSAGVVYPSVRHRGGTCVACFRPVLVMNVRQGQEFSLAFEPRGASPSWSQIS